MGMFKQSEKEKLIRAWTKMQVLCTLCASSEQRHHVRHNKRAVLTIGQ